MSIRTGKIERCPNCSVEVSPSTQQCLHCGTQIGESLKARSFARKLTALRIAGLILIAGILLAATPWLPQAIQWLRLQWRLQNSQLVFEAVSRVNGNARAADLLGKPIEARWLVRGYIRDDETGWRDGKLWIPVRGSQGDGTLYARVGKGSGPWVFSELELSTSDGTVVNLLEPSSSTPRVKLQARGPTYLIPLGGVESLGLQELPEYYRKTFDLEVKLLPPVRLGTVARDSIRMQFAAQDLVDTMKRHYPQLAKDDSAVLIGITEEDMYIRNFDWRFAYTYRRGRRFAVVSSARLKPSLYGLPEEKELLRTRVRKVVSRDIGLLVYGLPHNDDPTSLLYNEMWSVRDIDLALERFDGLGALAVVSEFRNAHLQPPSTPEFRADLVKSATADGRYPCLLIQRRNDGKPGAEGMEAEITQCLPRALIHSPVEEIEVDLRKGMLLTRTTDLFIPDAIPLALTRCYRLWDERPLPFGTGTNHVWDMNPTGSRQPYTYIDVALCDGSTLHFDRISKGSGYADAVYEHWDTQTPFLRSRFSWNGKGWDLRLQDGSLLLFPEAYYAKRPVDGAITGYRDAEGRSVQVKRDRHRNLRRITSPAGHFIDFQPDPNGRIIQAVDHQSRTVKYEYDSGGRLVLVKGPNSVRRHWYDGIYLTAIDENQTRLVDIHYTRGRVSRLSLPDGRSYHFRFERDPQNRRRIVRTFVTGPDKTVNKFEFPSVLN